MSSDTFMFDSADHFTVDTIGEPGHRIFLVQVGQDDRVATFKVEKQQVAALSNYLGELLADLASPGHLPEEVELREPIDIAWAVGAMAVRYDEFGDRLIIDLEEADGQAADDDDDPLPMTAIARIGVSRDQGAFVAIKGLSLVEAGRPACPLCGYPMDPDGHACPRANGHRPPSL